SDPAHAGVGSQNTSINGAAFCAGSSRLTDSLSLGTAGRGCSQRSSATQADLSECPFLPGPDSLLLRGLDSYLSLPQQVVVGAGSDNRSQAAPQAGRAISEPERGWNCDLRSDHTFFFYRLVDVARTRMGFDNLWHFDNGRAGSW